MGARRALLIGSQTGGLTGVHADVEVMADALIGLDFEVRTIIEAAASGDGMRQAYAELIDDTTTDDAAVVYYSGHGARVRNAMRARDTALPAWLQYLVPTDIDDRTAGRFGGLLAEELSALQWELSQRTSNVTTILDCCHSSRMSRNPGIVPRADTRIGFPWPAVAARWADVRGRVGPGDANPTAVQVVACEPDQSAYEVASSSIGGTHGALTAALVTVLRRPDARSLSWTEVLEVVRPAILDTIPAQRPDLIGTRSARRRRLFTLDEKDTVGALPVVVDGGQAWLHGAALFAVAEGDCYAVVAAGGDVRQPLATAVVEGIEGDRARLRLDGITAADVPAGVLAHPVQVSLGRRPVAVAPVDHPDTAAVLDVLRRSTHVRPAEGSVGALATVQLGDGGMVLLDAGGAALTAAPRPVSPASLDELDEALWVLARATHVRNLERGDDALAADVEVVCSRLEGPTKREIRLSGGEHLFVGDALVVRARNRADSTRYVTVLDVGLSGAVTVITRAQPSGTTVAAGDELVVGEDASHVLTGVELFWPPALPSVGPRPEALIILVADAPIDGLPQLEQSGVDVTSRSADRRSAIERLIDEVSVGRRDARPPDAAAPTVRYCVHRLDFLLHPARRPDQVDEPEFAVDERPDPSFRLVPPHLDVDVPGRIAVRLTERSGHGRTDWLVATEQAAQATTIRLDGAEPRQVETILFDGPVHSPVELAAWHSATGQATPTLADALGADLDAPRDASSLISRAAEQLDQLTGNAAGVYRASFLAHERFGTGRPTRRHPAAGLIDAGPVAFAYEITAQVTAQEVTDG